LDDGAYAQANYLPYLLDPNNFSNISAPITQIPFIKPDGSVGGEMASDITMTLGGSPYHVVSTVVIPVGYTLVIQAGVKIFMDPLTSILFFLFNLLIYSSQELL
jgi:hypothetical protein